MKKLLGKSIKKLFSKDIKSQKIGIPSFNNYKLLPSLINYLEEKKIKTPSPIQQLSFSKLIQNDPKNHSSYFLGSPTGSGKTLSYILPIIQKLKKQEILEQTKYSIQNRPRAIIITPGRELTDQIYRVTQEICHSTKLKVEKVNTASNWKRNKRNLFEGVDILITNLNKLERLLKEGLIEMSLIKYVVFDEADVFIEMGESEKILDLIKKFQFRDDLEHVPKFLYVSATLTKRLDMFLRNFYESDIFFMMTEKTHFNLANLNHDFIHVGTRNRLELLNSELEKKMKKKNIENLPIPEEKKKEKYFLVFCNSISSTRAVDFYLNKMGYNVTSLHGEMPNKMRIENYKNFRDKKFNIMVTSDLAARGLDFTFLDGVVNFDFPKNVNDYIHRSGRAGRIGNKGDVINFYYKKNLSVVEQLEKSHNQNIPLEITESSYSLKTDKKEIMKNKNNKGIKKNDFDKKNQIDLKKTALPSDYIEFQKEFNRESKYKESKGFKKVINNKTRPDFKYRKVKELKKSVKKLVKATSKDNKRVTFLKKQIKQTNRQRTKGFDVEKFKKQTKNNKKSK